LRKKQKIKKKQKKLIGKGLLLRQKLRRRTYEISKAFTKHFFTKLGKRDLKNRDYEDFFKSIGTDELLKLGLDPDEIRIKLDQIMEWNDPNFKPRETNE